MNFQLNSSGLLLKTPKILMITSSYDKTCDYLINKYKDISFFRFNLDNFSNYRVTYTSSRFTISHFNNFIYTDSCLSIYFRKPSMENLDGVFEKKYHSYVHKETYSLIEGIVESFDGITLTKPSIMRKANNKVFQASLIEKTGFITPELSITNSDSILEYFSQRNGIIKPVAIGEITTNSTKEFVQTNKINPSFNTDSFHYSPVYLQDYLEKDYEVRITIIDENIFPVKILSKNNIDWRKPNNTVSYSACSIPKDIRCKCLHFMDLCNMKFGCFDFIIKDDTWYFLVMNANGQWLWLEYETGLSISASIISHLMTNSKSVRFNLNNEISSL